MAEYIVTAQVIGLPGETPEPEPVVVRAQPGAPTYHHRNEIVEIDDEDVAQRLLDLGAIKSTSDATDEEQAAALELQEQQEAASAQHQLQQKVDADKVAEKAAAEQAVVDAEAAREQAEKDAAEAEEAAAEGEGEKLTEKQSLVKRAEELELDTEGTIPELKERIAAKEAEGK